MAFVIPALIALALVVFLVRTTRPRFEFSIDLEGNRLEVRRGKVPNAFLKEGRKLLDNVPARGTLTGVKRGDRIALEFSNDVPRVLHQRFRNIWGLTNAQ